MEPEEEIVCLQTKALLFRKSWPFLPQFLAQLSLCRPPPPQTTSFTTHTAGSSVFSQLHCFAGIFLVISLIRVANTKHPTARTTAETGCFLVDSALRRRDRLKSSSGHDHAAQLWHGCLFRRAKFSVTEQPFFAGPDGLKTVPSSHKL